MLTLQALIYTEGHIQTGGTILNNATGTLTLFKVPDAVLNQIVLSISTVEKSTPMQVVKHSQNTGELQPPRNKNVPPFRRTMIND